jgi:branched-subunit amino acid transport protein
MLTSYWLALALVAGGTLAFRLAFMSRGRAPSLPPLAKRAMDYVPPAVLSALALPEFINPGHFSLPAALALAAALTASLATKRDFLAILAGLAVYWIAL